MTGIRPHIYVSEVAVFARVISTQTTVDRLEEGVRIVHEQLPGARAQHGYRGFYLLSDPAAGSVMTISLWESYVGLQAVEARAAGIRESAVQSFGATLPTVHIYRVEVADQA
jgi:hypothetical protein